MDTRDPRPPPIKKILILFSILILIGIFWVFDFGKYLTLSYIKETQVRFAEIYEANRPAVIAGYMLIYILVTSLSLPGAVVMTLAGGALFGLLTGTIVISFASTIGATIACLFSRFILRDWIQAKFGDRLNAVNKGIEKEGPYYLFTLRLIPIFPFWLVNLAMGLTSISLSKFYWISQLGMLPGTIVYVNAGKELGKIDSVSGIFSPGLIISFILLGLFPLVSKKTMAIIKAKNGSG